ncbi:GNAT family N-acetyltransferase [Isoptericola sp. NPDC056573]|uniref:GNAT family N-acetyltransferase n=1 Tax=Isoptericola sp. NPDC056573 TaxID=3345868 RepID=UPI0036D009CA
MLIRRELPTDAAAVRAVTAAAFAGAPYSAPPVEPDGAPGEATLVGLLRADECWIPELAFVAGAGDDVVGHVVCTRARVGDDPALVLGPLSVHPDHQARGVGSALVHTVLGAADALGEPLVVLVGDPAYYSRFGFAPAPELGVEPDDPALARFFQARPLTAYEPSLRGRFAAPAPFAALEAMAADARA